jgi:hypothetical protein
MHASVIFSTHSMLVVFLSNGSSFVDQVAIWRDVKRCRLVFAFRGTEQVYSTHPACSSI